MSLCFRFWREGDAGLALAMDCADLMVRIVRLDPDLAQHTRFRQRVNAYFAQRNGEAQGEGSARGTSSAQPMPMGDDNRRTRVELSTFLLSLSPESPAAQDLAVSLATRLVAANAHLNTHTRHMIDNSQVFREKVRLHQTLLLLARLLPRRAVPALADATLEAIAAEPMPTLRYLQEWLLTLLSLHDMAAVMDKILTAIVVSRGRAFLTCSLLVALLHISQLDGAAPYAQAILERAMPMAMSHHSALRAHAQAIIVTLYPLVPDDDSAGHAGKTGTDRTFAALLPNLADRGTAVRACVHFLEANEDVQRQVSGIRRDFFFSEFHALRHLTVSFIFDEGPQRLGLFREEWIGTDQFVAAGYAPDAHRSDAVSLGLIAPSVQASRTTFVHAMWSGGGGCNTYPLSILFICVLGTGMTIILHSLVVSHPHHTAFFGCTRRSRKGVIQAYRAVRDQEAGITSPTSSRRGEQDVPLGLSCGGYDDEEDEDDPGRADALSDAQKKIVVGDWALDGGSASVSTGSATALGGDSLIVVASLIDKAVNTGGLCRTGEIFGVSSLVMESQRVADSKDFQTVAMSADHWLPLEYVTPTDLRAWLVAKRDQGYALVGAEQTERSVHLPDFVFPRKTVLVLGRERDGIPVDIIEVPG